MCLWGEVLESTRCGRFEHFYYNDKYIVTEFREFNEKYLRKTQLAGLTGANTHLFKDNTKDDSYTIHLKD